MLYRWFYRTFTLPHLTLMHPSFLNAPWYPLRCSTSIHSPVHTSSISIYSTAAETYCQPYLVRQCTNPESNKSSIQSLGHINITSSITKWLHNHPKPIFMASKSPEAPGSLQWVGLLQYIYTKGASTVDLELFQLQQLLHKNKSPTAAVLSALTFIDLALWEKPTNT